MKVRPIGLYQSLPLLKLSSTYRPVRNLRDIVRYHSFEAANGVWNGVRKTIQNLPKRGKSAKISKTASLTIPVTY
jgi:hypothetical protein